MKSLTFCLVMLELFISFLHFSSLPIHFHRLLLPSKKAGWTRPAPRSSADVGGCPPHLASRGADPPPQGRHPGDRAALVRFQPATLMPPWGQRYLGTSGDAMLPPHFRAPQAGRRVDRHVRPDLCRASVSMPRMKPRPAQDMPLALDQGKTDCKFLPARVTVCAGNIYSRVRRNPTPVACTRAEQGSYKQTHVCNQVKGHFRRRPNIHVSRLSPSDGNPWWAGSLIVGPGSDGTRKRLHRSRPTPSGWPGWHVVPIHTRFAHDLAMRLAILSHRLRYG